MGSVAKGNTMFYTAYKLGLVDKEYVTPVPGAPMCGCLESMPSVSNSACTEAMKVTHTMPEQSQLMLNSVLALKILWQQRWKPWLIMKIFLQCQVSLPQEGLPVIAL